MQQKMTLAGLMSGSVEVDDKIQENKDRLMC